MAANSISIWPYEGYPTTSAMRVYVSFTVASAGTYKSYFELYTASGTLVATSSGNSYSMSAGETKEGSNFYKTFTGLSSNTSYYIVASLWNVSTNTRLPINEPKVYFTTLESDPKLTIIYRDGASSETTAAKASHTIRGPFKSDMAFLGWSTELSSIVTSYAQGDPISVGSSSRTITLYAVYQNPDKFYCWYIQGGTGSLVNNVRDKIQYRCNTSNTTSSTNFYNTVELPTFGSTNATLSASTSQSAIGPDRTWTAVGWRRDTTAGNYEYAPGQAIATNYINGDLYAVYSNECSITYNANGGSGSMAAQTQTAYANAAGSYTTPTFNISSCSFAAPGRPNDWSWTSTVQRGATMAYTKSGDTIIPKPLTATEWKNFISRIQAFATACEVSLNSTYLSNATSGVSSGSPMKASQANAARNLINQLSPKTAVPNAVSSGGSITAAFINGLKDSLNSVPGKQFDHWNVKADDSGTKYYAGGTVSTNYNVIFYAIWVVK